MWEGTKDNRLENPYKYNGKELNHDEFSDETGIDWYSYGFREYDLQIGRFPQLDPLTDGFPELTPYQYASDEPIANIDMDGLEAVGSIGRLTSTFSEAAYRAGQLTENVVKATKPITTSVKVLKGLNVLENIGSIALHGLQATAVIVNKVGVTKQVGNQTMAMNNDGWKDLYKTDLKHYYRQTYGKEGTENELGEEFENMFEKYVDNTPHSILSLRRSNVGRD